MKEFETAAKAVLDSQVEDESGESLEGVIDFDIVEKDDQGEEVHRHSVRAYKPDDGQLTMMVAIMGQGVGMEDQISVVIDFMFGIVDDNSKTYLRKRMFDRMDPFGPTDLLHIMFDLVEEWGGRPTKQPSDFARSRKSGGRSSTRRTPALT